MKRQRRDKRLNIHSEPWVDVTPLLINVEILQHTYFVAFHPR